MAGEYMVSGVGPCDGHLADVAVEPERLPHGFGGVHDIGLAAVVGVALVHHLGLHGAPVMLAGDVDHLAAPASARVPPRRQRHDHVLVAVELAVALRRRAALLALLEAVHRHHAWGAAAAAAATGAARRGAVGLLVLVLVQHARHGVVLAGARVRLGVVPGHGARRHLQQDYKDGHDYKLGVCHR
ncbi:hypothetical protein VPH35_014389 [Triticum aestivum]